MVALAMVFAHACASHAFEVNVGPFFEYDSEMDFVAVRPLWSTTPCTEDFVWPLGTWHTNGDSFWYRFLFLVHGHERSFNVFPLWSSGRDPTSCSWMTSILRSGRYTWTIPSRM